jgi:hypothetical protein
METSEKEPLTSKECIILNFQDEVNKRRYKEVEEKFRHLCDHLYLPKNFGNED